MTGRCAALCDEVRRWDTIPAMRVLWLLFSRTIQEFSRDNALRLAAAVAFYSALSLAPALVVTFTLVGWLSNDPETREEIIAELGRWLGDDGATAIRAVLSAANQPRGQSLATWISIGTLLFSGTAVFAEIQESMNSIWNTKPQPGRYLWRYIRKRLMGVSLMMVMGLMVLLSILSTSILHLLLNFIDDWIPADERMVRGLNFSFSLMLFTLLFALMFKVLPDVRLRWSDIWPGAILTTILFVIGKELLGIYVGRTSTRSAYGAAGSLVVLLLWVYYSSMILFFGAEFTQVYSEWRAHEDAAASSSEPDETAPPSTASLDQADAAAAEIGSDAPQSGADPDRNVPNSS